MAVIASEFPTSTGFDHVKGAQIAAFFVEKQHGPIDKLKLIKLIYLAERLSFERRARPMNFDDFFSLPHGPIASSALNGINGKAGDSAWSALKLIGNKVCLVADIGTDHLSKNELRLLEETWDRFGKMGAIELRNWTHDHCSEYFEVDGGRASITYDEILQAVGVENAEEVARDLRRFQREVGRLPRANAS